MPRTKNPCPEAERAAKIAQAQASPTMTSWVFEDADALMEECDRWKERAHAAEVERDELKKQVRELKKFRRVLKEFSGGVGKFLRALDLVMKAPHPPELGKQVAQLANVMEVANDRVRYFHLGVNFRNDRKKELADYEREEQERLELLVKMADRDTRHRIAELMLTSPQISEEMEHAAHRVAMNAPCPDAPAVVARWREGMGDGKE